MSSPIEYKLGRACRINLHDLTAPLNGFVRHRLVIFSTLSLGGSLCLLLSMQTMDLQLPSEKLFCMVLRLIIHFSVYRASHSVNFHRYK